MLATLAFFVSPSIGYVLYYQSWWNPRLRGGESIQEPGLMQQQGTPNPRNPSTCKSGSAISWPNKAMKPIYLTRVHTVNVKFQTEEFLVLLITLKLC